MRQELVDLYEGAKSGNAVAQKELAAALAAGTYGDVDLESAYKWYEKSALQGLIDSKWNLGLMILNGEGTNKCTEKGLALIQLAADEGSWDALCFLRDCYRSGLYGLEKSDSEYQRYHKRANDVLDCEEDDAPIYGKKLTKI